MSNRIRTTETVTAIGLAVAAAIAGWYLGYSGGLGLVRLTGLFLGLLGGGLSVLLDPLGRRPHLRRRAARGLSVALSPLGYLLFLPWSPQLGGGYFVGASITFCLCHAAATSAQTAESEPHSC